MANALLGAIIGSIVLLPYLAWPFSGHGIIMFDWTKRFLIVSIAWGIVCGITIGLLPIAMNLSIARRILTGMIVGGFSGWIFYLIGDLAFFTKDSFLTIMLKSLWGLGVGIISGGFCAYGLGKLNRSLKWIAIKVDSSNQSNPDKKRLFKEKVLSALIGLNAGSFVGNFLLVFIGQAIITLFRTIYSGVIAPLYFLPLFFGCFTAIYLYIRPLKNQLMRNIMDGLRNGIIFGWLFFLYLVMFSIMVSQFSFAKPEFMKDDFLWLVLGVVVVYTALFGSIYGATKATLESFILELKANVK